MEIGEILRWDGEIQNRSAALMFQSILQVVSARMAQSRGDEASRLQRFLEVVSDDSIIDSNARGDLEQLPEGGMGIVYTEVAVKGPESQ